MIKLLYKIYHKYSNAKIVRMMGDVYRNGFFVSNYLAYLKMKKLANKKKNLNRPIRIVFLCQYLQAWNKMKSVFELMQKDERFQVKILAVPDNIEDINDKIYKSFKELYGEEYVIDAYVNGGWYNLEKDEPDYVFFQRPYDQYLPKVYKSGQVAKYSKVCHLVYGYLLTETNKNICTNRLFFRNVYYYFAENSVCKDFNINRFKISHKKGYRKTVNIGYPVLEYFMQHKEKYNKKADEDFKVLWTPRWSEDKETGGSNFINFKDKVVKLPKENSRFYLVFRPHPMTFDHFISVNRMTQKEVDDYLELYEKDERLEYNNTPEYISVLWDTDALLTDVSSIIVEYFLTGKPIVYCDTGAIPDTFFKEMLKVMYVVKTYDEAKEKLMMLANGEDPLKKARQKKIEELMGKDFENISERYLEEIYRDYHS